MVESSVNTVSGDSWNAADHVSERTLDAKQSRSSVATRPVALKYASDEDPRKKEWASSLLLIQEACEAIKASEERVESLERELEMAAFQTREEQRQTTAKLNSAQDEVLAANARAKAMEARAQEAEGWLRRLNDAIVDGFGKQNKPEDQ
jgi:hypothetical protein